MEELKIAMPEIEIVMKRLMDIGAKSNEQVKEIDTYFDDLKGNLRGFNKVLRIRDNGKKIFLCFKDLKSLDVPGLGRKETEVEINDVKKHFDILNGLGFKPVARLEKIRQIFTYQRAKICLDKLPFMGYFLDITGRKESMDLVVERLSLDRAQNLTKNYLELFKDYTKETGIRIADDNELTFLSETRYEKI